MDRPTAIESRSRLTCPECATTTELDMPVDSCSYFFECPACKVILSPLAGDCCVFCSFGDVPCPPVQRGGENACK